MALGDKVVQEEAMAVPEHLENRVEFGTARQMIEQAEDFERPSPQELLRVNLACGRDMRGEGWINIDSEFKESQDNNVKHDLLEFPWPLKDNSVYEMHCSHFVEHVPHDLHNGKRKDGLVQFMEEAYRVLMPHGTFHIVAPYYTSIRAWQDPTHCRCISDVTWTYFNKEHMELQGLDHYAGDCNFETMSRQHILDEEYIHKSEEARKWAMRHNWNVVKDLAVVLRAIK